MTHNSFKVGDPVMLDGAKGRIVAVDVTEVPVKGTTYKFEIPRLVVLVDGTTDTFLYPKMDDPFLKKVDE